MPLSDPAGALERAADLAVLAPSVHNTQPWRLDLDGEALSIRADRSRQLPALDPSGRELTLSVGAALFNARVALAAQGFAARVTRFPTPADPDLLAEVRPADGLRDAALAALAPAVAHRRTNRRRYDGARVPDDVMRRLTSAAVAEDTSLVPVLADRHLQLLGALTRQADRIQTADPGYRAEVQRWTARRPLDGDGDGDGVPAAVVPRADAARRDELPLRDLDPHLRGGLPPATASDLGQTLVLLVSQRDDPGAWLRCGEAMQRVALELTLLGWVAAPVTQALEVPVTRTQLRSALSWHAHPQLLLRIGRADPTPATPRRPREAVVSGARPSPSGRHGTQALGRGAEGPRAPH